MHKTNVDRIMELCFNKHETRTGEVIYWRDCCIVDCRPDEQGYLWVYSDGETFHSYTTPENL